jgi:MFS family permease
MSRHSRAKALAPVLVMTAAMSSIISSLGAQLIPTVAKQFHESLSTSQWALTVTLLAGTISAPVLGRLGDGPRRRATMIGGLASVTIGCMLAAVAPSLLVLVIGRGLQGVGLGLVPLTMATARAEMAKDRVTPMIALLSVSSAAGVGVGYPFSGLLADVVGLSGPFWFGAIASGVALVCVAVVVPRTEDRGQQPHLDVVGAVLLSIALIGILVAVAQGSTWGWGSSAVVRLFILGAVATVAWVLQQLRAKAPLVDLRLLRHRAILAGDVCAIVLGVAMYMALSSVTEFVQLPAANGFGFSASVVVAGLILVPLSVFMLAGGRALPLLSRMLNVRSLLTIGCLLVAVSCSFFALFHGSLWESFAMMGFLGAGLGTTFAAIPGLIVRSVPPHETGSAMGFYQVVRYVGFSFGSALTATILASHISTTTKQPDVGGYTMVLWVATAICLVAAFLAWVLTTGGGALAPGASVSDDEVRMLETTDGESFIGDPAIGEKLPETSSSE